MVDIGGAGPALKKPTNLQTTYAAVLKLTVSTRSQLFEAFTYFSAALILRICIPAKIL